MKDKAVVERKLKPVAIMFSEYYFYLIAFIDDENVRKGNSANEYSLCMVVSYKKVKFQYSGTDIDAVLDRLPTAQVLAEKDGIDTVSVEVFGTETNMWLRSQGNMIKMIDLGE